MRSSTATRELTVDLRGTGKSIQNSHELNVSDRSKKVQPIGSCGRSTRQSETVKSRPLFHVFPLLRWSKKEATGYHVVSRGF